MEKAVPDEDKENSRNRCLMETQFLTNLNGPHLLIVWGEGQQDFYGLFYGIKFLYYRLLLQDIVLYYDTHLIGIFDKNVKQNLMYYCVPFLIVI